MASKSLTWGLVRRPMPTHWMEGWQWQPPEQANMIFWGVEGVHVPQSTPLFRQWCIATTSECHTHPQPPTKLYPIAWWVFSISRGDVGKEHKASCGVLGSHFHRLQPWSAMAVLAVVGRGRLTSDLPSVGIAKIVYRSNFVYSYVEPIHSWQLTQPLKRQI